MPNPMMYGIIAAVLVYSYLYYRDTQADSKDKKKINIKLPLLAGLLVWFISGKFINTNLKLNSEEDFVNQSMQNGCDLSKEPLIKELADF